nr:MAG TPA: hypothetical protein [Caudoviricetes sp.]
MINLVTLFSNKESKFVTRTKIKNLAKCKDTNFKQSTK